MPIPGLPRRDLGLNLHLYPAALRRPPRKRPKRKGGGGGEVAPMEPDNPKGLSGGAAVALELDE
jgi:hypothetical protein